jgi:hypothetical protein
MLVSQTEQELACTSGQAAAFEVCIFMHVSDIMLSVTTDPNILCAFSCFGHNT